MNFIEAISILELKTNFTKDDLVKAHRICAKKYHPDIIGESGHAKMIQVNTAYQVCERYLQDHVVPDTSELFNQADIMAMSEEMLFAEFMRCYQKYHFSGDIFGKSKSR